MIIDCHAHACGDNLTVKSLTSNLDKNNVNWVVLVPGELNSSKTYKFKEINKSKVNFDNLLRTNKLVRMVMTITGMKRIIKRGNNYVFSLKQEAPERIKQFYWLTKKIWSQIDDDYYKMKFEGIKIHQCWDYFKVNSQWFDDVIKWSITHDLPIFIHLYSYNDVHQLIRVIKKYPDAKIIIAHFFGLEIYMNEDKKIYSNVYFDISNMYFVSGVRIIKAINYFGSQRIVLGSDTPYGVDALGRTISLIRDLDINSKSKDDILGENMRLLLNIQSVS